MENSMKAPLYWIIKSSSVRTHEAAEASQGEQSFLDTLIRNAVSSDRKKYATMQAKGISISPLRRAQEAMHCVQFSAAQVCDDVR